MKRPIWLIAGIVIAVLIAWFALRSGGPERVVVNLIDQFPSAKAKRPSADVFSIVDATIDNVTKRAILVKDPSRLVYEVTLPDDAELKVSLGLLPEAWTTKGDGVLFRILLGAGGAPEEILSLQVNPYENPGDRRWSDITLDLSEYAGETVDLFFNTNSSPPARPPRDDRNGDLAVWGAPRIVSR